MCALFLLCKQLLPAALEERMLTVWTFSLGHSRTICRKQLIGFWNPEG